MHPAASYPTRQRVRYSHWMACGAARNPVAGFTMEKNSTPDFCGPSKS